jgi:peptide/nickel transport system permease protein
LTRYLARRLAFAALLVAIEQARARYGLNKSIGAQYRDWLAAAVRLDFGRSMQYDRPVRDLIPERAANTAILALTALVIATAVGLPLGIVAGSRRGGLVPGAIRSASVVLLSMPPLLTSLFLVFVAARTGWFPIAGMRSATIPAGGAARRPSGCRWPRCSSGCRRRR